MGRIFAIGAGALVVSFLLALFLALFPLGLYGGVLSGQVSLVSLCEKSWAKDAKLGICVAAAWMNSGDKDKAQKLSVGIALEAPSTSEGPPNSVVPAKPMAVFRDAQGKIQRPLRWLSRGVLEDALQEGSVGAGALSQGAPDDFPRPARPASSEGGEDVTADPSTGLLPPRASWVTSDEPDATPVAQEALEGPEETPINDLAPALVPSRKAVKKRTVLAPQRVTSAEDDNSLTEVEKILSKKSATAGGPLAR